MKKLLLSLFLVLSFSIYSQTITQQIDSAKSFNEMPVLRLTVTRETNSLQYVLSNGKLTDTHATLPAGEMLTLYYPVQVYDSGNWTRAEEKYNYIVTTPELTDTTILIHRNLVMNVSSPDRRLLIDWLNKYEALGKQRMKIEQPHLPGKAAL